MRYMKNKLTNASNSPLRYPGGKGKISLFVGNVLVDNEINGTYIEPFAGGAGVAINLLLANKIRNIVINDLDDGVYSFWKTVVADPEYLLRRIRKVPFDYIKDGPKLTPDAYARYWSEVKKRFDFDHYTDYRCKGFDFFMLNRMNVSGIVRGGPIGGHEQTGKYDISARFNRETLCRRIERIAGLSSRITVTNLEASYFCKVLSKERYCSMSNALVFVDPPYYVQGRNLYNSFATDRIHKLMAERLLQENGWKWILTYDKAPQIDKLYPATKVNKYEYQISYSANKRGKYSEYLFTSPELHISSFDNVSLHALF
ncbi:DNA adenine methylase [Bifidobacterium longum]|nr:DNA adenine methylase [Bifidobacterium longum]RHJ32090.1 DNA adenine methylase [Bifidobacterium longum]